MEKLDEDSIRDMADKGILLVNAETIPQKYRKNFEYVRNYLEMLESMEQYKQANPGSLINSDLDSITSFPNQELFDLYYAINTPPQTSKKSESRKSTSYDARDLKVQKEKLMAKVLRQHPLVVQQILKASGPGSELEQYAIQQQKAIQQGVPVTYASQGAENSWANINAQAAMKCDEKGCRVMGGRRRSRRRNSKRRISKKRKLSKY